MTKHKNPKNASLRVVTANRLRQGDVVSLTVSGTWSHHLNESRASDDKSDLEAMLAKAADAVAARLVVGPYAFEVVEIEIGSASCRERVCQYVEITVVYVSLKK